MIMLAAAIALAAPSSASALSFTIVNESGQQPEDVYVTVAGAASGFDVPGMTNDTPVALSAIPNQTLTINELVSGRIYVSYGAPVTMSVPFDAQTRFDWAELTVTPSSSDVANLTAVDQFGIGMRLDTFDSSDDPLETVGSANSDTVFAALQQIPGGPQATVRDASGDVLRVLSPNQSDAYPDLTDYVLSMSGQTVTLNTAFFGAPFTTSRYSGTFAADGSITLSGTTNPAGQAPASFTVAGSDLIDGIYTGANTPNTLQGAITRDLFAAFSTGFWGGRYGNVALGFCSDAITTAQGSWCPNGFNQPAFGDARAALSPFATCEQYAAVVNAHSDVYGNPYSDAAKKVTVGLDQAGSGGDVATLKLTILPDSGSARPSAGGNANCGAAPPKPTRPARAKPVSVKWLLDKRAAVHGRVATIGRVRCSGPCGRVAFGARHWRRLAGRTQLTTRRADVPLKLRLNDAGVRLLRHHRALRVRVIVVVAPRGQRAQRRVRTIVLKPAPRRHARRR